MQDKFWTGRLSDLHSEQRTDLEKTGVYLIVHSAKPSVYYIGSAAKHDKVKYREIGFLQRWRHHYNAFKRGTHHNRHLRAVVNKYGLHGLTFKIVEICQPTECLSRETFYIQLYKKEHSIYNHSDFAMGVLGISHPVDSVKKRAAKRAKKVYQYDLDGNFVREWASYTEAKRNHTGSGSITKCLLGITKSAGGFQWSYLMEQKFPYRQYYHKVEQPVYQFDLNGNLLNKFDNPTVAAEKTSVRIAYIFRSLNHIYVRGGDFIWSWEPIEKRKWPMTKRLTTLVKQKLNQ